MSRNQTIDAKRKRVIEVIERTAPHIGQLAGMLDETKLDLILIALAGERISLDEDGSHP